MTLQEVLPMHEQMSHACFTQADSNAISSELEQLSVELCPLEKLELDIAEQEGLPMEDVDPIVVLSMVRDKLLHNADYLPIVEKLLQLHHLCLQYSHAQRNLPDPHHVEASQFWAILIGINEYASYPLQGPVPDMQLMEKSKDHMYLEDLMYPSHAHIIDALLSLTTNPKIMHSDNIIIYYSGHGSYYPPHMEEDSETDYIGTLCPIDRDSLGDDGKHVLHISDHEFNATISLISQAKGHHIIVILDCCYSGGICQNILEPGAHTSLLVVCATLQDMLATGEKNLMCYPEYRSILAEDWLPDMDSHVTLAVCRDYQYAREKKVKQADGSVMGYIGIFTDLLMPVIAGKHKYAHLWYQA
ncbi:hypothetical protein EDD18DRAFT_1098861 [Armillaria luteobubalina]|uniref:Peptidase C14 caspase domain-containing protein n=1 Tax=Armillaria luteobubalina TaxID=153913 RepID=A0AA39V4P9_9AGAR|nr:hypothetical protein EDD18DRAFT_1098861 [Armillaria luteobubalina]